MPARPSIHPSTHLPRPIAIARCKPQVNTRIVVGQQLTSKDASVCQFVSLSVRVLLSVTAPSRAPWNKHSGWLAGRTMVAIIEWTRTKTRPRNISSFLRVWAMKEGENFLPKRWAPKSHANSETVEPRNDSKQCSFTVACSYPSLARVPTDLKTETNNFRVANEFIFPVHFPHYLLYPFL